MQDYFENEKYYDKYNDLTIDSNDKTPRYDGQLIYKNKSFKIQVKSTKKATSNDFKIVDLSPSDAGQIILFFITNITTEEHILPKISFWIPKAEEILALKRKGTKTVSVKKYVKDIEFFFNYLSKTVFDNAQTFSITEVHNIEKDIKIPILFSDEKVYTKLPEGDVFRLNNYSYLTMGRLTQYFNASNKEEKFKDLEWDFGFLVIEIIRNNPSAKIIIKWNKVITKNDIESNKEELLKFLSFMKEKLTKEHNELRDNAIWNVEFYMQLVNYLFHLDELEVNQIEFRWLSVSMFFWQRKIGFFVLDDKHIAEYIESDKKWICAVAIILEDTMKEREVINQKNFFAMDEYDHYCLLKTRDIELSKIFYDDFIINNENFKNLPR